jgi:hypothetical protein
MLKSIYELYAFAEELIEDAMLGGDTDTAEIIENAVDNAQILEQMDAQLAELMMGFVSVEDRVNVPNYPVESVIRLRSTLRGMNNDSRKRYLH